MFLVGALALAACAGDEGRPGQEDSPLATVSTSSPPSSTLLEADASQVTTVGIAQFRFTPERVQVTVGGAVEFSNSDRIDHTVTAGTPDTPSGEFDELLDGAGTKTTLTFDTVGEFDYFCNVHPHMRGTVEVVELP